MEYGGFMRSRSGFLAIAASLIMAASATGRGEAACNLRTGIEPYGVYMFIGSRRVLDLLDRFHYDVAFYVEDEAMRREMPDYYGPQTLRQKAEAFLRELSE